MNKLIMCYWIFKNLLYIEFILSTSIRLWLWFPSFNLILQIRDFQKYVRHLILTLWSLFIPTRRRGEAWNGKFNIEVLTEESSDIMIFAYIDLKEDAGRIQLERTDEHSKASSAKLKPNFHNKLQLARIG